MANNDKELNDYLKGNSELSEQYRQSNTMEPSAHVDKTILSAAREEVTGRRYRSAWTVPVSVAAVVTLSVSIVLTMQEETGQTIFNKPETEMYDSAILAEEAVLQKKNVPEKVSTPDKIGNKTTKDADIQVMAPAESAAVEGYRIDKNEIHLNSEVDAIQQESQDRAVEFSRSYKKNDIVPEKKRMEARAKRKTKDSRQTIIKEQQLQSEPASSPAAITADSEYYLDDELNENLVNFHQQELINIKMLWEEGNFTDAKLAFDEFIKNRTDVTEDTMVQVLGSDVYQALNEM